MKRYVLCLFIIVLAVSLTACAKSNNIIDDVPIRGDWIVYDSLDDVENIADCIVVGTVVSKGDSFSTSYEKEQYQDYTKIASQDSYTASMMKISIRTPYSVRVDEVISSNNDANVSDGELIEIFQMSGQICNVKLVVDGAEKFDVGEKCVFILNKREWNQQVYYSLITPIQGFAELSTVSSADSQIQQTMIVDTNNPIFSRVKSIEDVRKELK